MLSWGKLWTKRYKKTQNPAAPLEKPGEKAGYHPGTLHTAAPRGWADHISHVSSWNPGPASTLTHIGNQLAPLGE